MSLRETRTRRDRRFHCEFLEDRSLLSAGMPANVSVEIHDLKSKSVTQVIKGSINGYYAVNGALEVGLKGNGMLSVMGETTITGEYKLGVNIHTHKSTASGGTATFSEGNGTVSVSFSGSGKTKNGVFGFSMKGKVTGGTGEFSGATGKFTTKGTSPTGAVGPFEMNVSLKTKTPA
ncbi:MAG: hypothetical protein ACLQGP_20380 [Isosphaeraceae bacterium]